MPTDRFRHFSGPILGIWLHGLFPPAISKHNATKQDRSAKSEPILQVSETCFGGDARLFDRGFNGGCTAADGCRERLLLAAILQEANDLGAQRRDAKRTDR